MNFNIQKKDISIVTELLVVFKNKMVLKTAKIDYLNEYPNILVEWQGNRRGFISLGLFFTVVELNYELYDRDIEQHKKTLQSFSKYLDLFRKEYRELKERYEKK